MNSYKISFRLDKEDDDYIRSVSKDICTINEVYRSIYTKFCDGIRRNHRKSKKKEGKKSVKTNQTDSKKGGRKEKGGSKSKHTGGGRVTNGKATKTNK